MDNAQCPLTYLSWTSPPKDISVAFVRWKVMVIMMPSYDLKWRVGIDSGSNAFNKASQLWAQSFPHMALPSGIPLEVIPWRTWKCQPAAWAIPDADFIPLLSESSSLALYASHVHQSHYMHLGISHSKQTANMSYLNFSFHTDKWHGTPMGVHLTPSWMQNKYIMISAFI